MVFHCSHCGVWFSLAHFQGSFLRERPLTGLFKEVCVLSLFTFRAHYGVWVSTALLQGSYSLTIQTPVAHFACAVGQFTFGSTSSC